MALFPVVLFVLHRCQMLEGNQGTAHADGNMFEMATKGPGPAQRLEEGSAQKAAAAVSVSQGTDGSAVSQVAGMGEAESATGVTLSALHSNA
jgi:hypothetical protein